MLAVGTLGLAALGVLLPGTFAEGAISPERTPTDGARLDEGASIFLRGIAADGTPIRFRGGMRMRMSCGQCHGIDGKGRRHQMFVTPDIRYRNLTDPAGMLECDGSRGDTFTEAQIRNAIAAGVDPEGKPLAWPMPRWQLTQQQLDSLVAYLKALP